MEKIALALITTLFVSMPAAAEEDADAILERLEKKFMENELEGTPSASSDTKEPVTEKWQYQGMEVVGKQPAEKEFKELEAAIRQLESDTEALAGKVQTTKESLLADSRFKNALRLEARLGDAKKIAWRSLKVLIDGYLIYEIPASTGFWLPVESIPLFAGPVKPGKHQVEFQARLTLRHLQETALLGDTLYSVSENFTIDVPTVGEKTFTVKVAEPKASDRRVQAVLEETVAKAP